MAQAAHFFLSANSGDGHQSLREQVTGNRTLYDLMILKGGPGGGKSTFLRQVGEAMEAADTPVEYLHCAGDPDSLDGVLLPELDCALLDGTAPHPAEPPYPPAVGRWVDLGRFLDLTAAKAAREEVIRLTGRGDAACIRAFHALKAARQVELDGRAAACRAVDWRRLNRRVEGVIARELRKPGGEPGNAQLRFLGTITHRGYVWRTDTVMALCPRLYELEDSFGLAAPVLRRLAEAAAERGWDAILCLCPEDPSQPEHLLIPGLGLAFVTSRPELRWDGKPYRRLRLDAMARPENKARLRFETRMAHLLRQEAVEALGEAKAAHDELEALCNPYVDFDGVRALAAVESARLLSWLQRRRETA